MTDKIPQTFIDDILHRTDIVEVIRSRVILKKTGNNYQGLCPFHPEKTPSFSVSAQKQFYHCFGCKASGNVIGFLMNHDKLSFLEALEWLCHRLGIALPESTYTPTSSWHKGCYETLERAAHYYETQLRASEAAIAYFRRRGLTEETMHLFRLGYASQGWQNLPSSIGPLDQQLQTGLILKKGPQHYDRFRDRVLFPIRDTRSRVIGFGGRTLTDAKPKYLNSPDTPLFHKGKVVYGLFEAKQTNSTLEQIIVVEGYMDVVSLAQHGITNVVATLGTATTVEQLTLLLRHTDHLIFCFDGDFAGKTAAWKALERILPLLNDGIQAHFLFLPESEDPDSLVRGIGKAAFQTLITQAIPLTDFLFTQLSERIDCTQIGGKAKFASLLKPLLEKMPFGLFRQLLEEKMRDFLKISRNTSPPTPPSTRFNLPSANTLTLYEKVLALLIQHPPLVDHWPISVKLGRESAAQNLDEVIQFLKDHPHIRDTGSLLTYRPENALALLAMKEFGMGPSQVEAEFSNLCQQIQKYQVEQVIQHLLAKAKQEELSADEKKWLNELIKSKNNKIDTAN